MDKSTRNEIQRATQAARKLLEDAYREQLEGTYDILLDGNIAEQPGSHLSERQKVTREKLVAAVAHKQSVGLKAKDAVDAYLREAAFTTLNRFVALKMLEARDLVQACVSRGEGSSGFKEFTALAPGLVSVEDKGYRLYTETLFDEIGQEVKVLFDRRDVASLLWPDRQTLLELLDIVNAPELASVWAEDETIGWVYQYFNGDEERNKMRAESQAPRNSYELAVRNQFFTPRYVVQFLTDNTLGRTWYEMMQGETKLADLDYLVRRASEVFLADGESTPESETDDSELSQEELLQQTVYVPFRPKKDPRDLRILDPACGSGHFLLYAFDLLVSIYEEAWSDAEAAAFTETGTQLRADYSSIADLRRAMPELILRQNLHGVDIDPRAAQIAALALWLRAQRYYNEFDVDRAQRPPITKTNIVVAEPMPGDAELVDEFASSLKPAVLGDLFKKMVEETTLAGELGSLLKIERSIAKAVKEAEDAHRQGSLFAGELEGRNFWDTADEKIIAALAHFAESAAGSAGVRRQLFAGDAAQGVAFIELMQKRFDTVLMNPPFGRSPQGAVSALTDHYRNGKNDLFAAFVLRGVDLVLKGGFLGAITNRTGFFSTHLLEWRRDILGRLGAVSSFVDLGAGVLDALVETAAYVIHREPDSKSRAICVNTVAANSPATYLAEAVTDVASRQRAEVRRDVFRKVPNEMFVYSLGGGVLDLFERFEPIDRRFVCTKGLSTDDDFRFVRGWWEVPSNEIHEDGWVWLGKGGAYSPYYYDVHLLVRWASSGREMAACAGHRGANVARTRQSSRYYFKVAAAFSRRTSLPLSARLMPSGCAFAEKTVACFPRSGDNDQNSVLCLVGLLNSSLGEQLSSSFTIAGDTAARSYESGTVSKFPFPIGGHEAALAKEVLAAWRLAFRAFGAGDEAAILFDGDGIGPSGVDQDLRGRYLADSLEAIDLSITKLACVRVPVGRHRELLADQLAQGAKAPIDALRLFSWCVGVALGRFDIRLATEERLGKSQPSPFAPLPTRSPAMLREEELDLGSYPLWIPQDGVLVSDVGHERDIHGRIRRVLETAFGETEDVFNELPTVGRTPAGSIHLWLQREFFVEHTKTHSKSRRKAPIYWQLATPSASYSVWCYYHRLTRDTFFRVANDFVTPKAEHEERKLDELRQEVGPDPSSTQRKTIDAQETFVSELRAFAAELTRIAPLWNPNLNDGVIINFAPLWRLVPQHKAWQKECKACWDKLCKGDYDWAHLAMHLWPERVVPTCRDDRSLAIAHGLEDDFWCEDEDGKWQKRDVNEAKVQALIDERRSAAVKTALAELLSAPTAAGSKKRKKARAANG